ncbi:hypothetical protein NBRC116583_27910 [Arenicella sp. 4NH20-0111]|uniref:type IV pilus modification protein PilV n=1 Tax=Arenicella sp. 4NH20-0111 TaxID=3127648 RepID=UPI003101B954
MKSNINTFQLDASRMDRARGATLVEAVVALFIFSLGALGLVSLQLTSLVSSGDSQQRSVVLWKAQEFADRIRANRGAVDKYKTAIGNEYNNIGKDTNDGLVKCESSGVFKKPSKICAETSGDESDQCNVDEMVHYDIWDVFCNPNDGLAVQSSVVADGNVGVTNLEVALGQVTPSALTIGGANYTPNGDLVLVMEWLSREAESNTDIASTKNVKTDLCGLVDDRDVASSLDVYCLRFAF